MKGKQKTVRIIALLVLLSTLVVEFAHGVGYRLPNQDPEAIARGNAFVATADNPSAIYYNPAGITQLDGQNIRAGVYVVTGGYEYESPTGDKTTADSEFVPVPQLYYVFSPKESPLSFGLGLYAPYGLSLDWGDDAPFSTIAQEGELTYLTINPVVSWAICQALSIGIGPTINYSDARFERALPGMPPAIPNGHFEIDGDGWGYGFNAGLLWKPHPKWALGASYRFSTEVEYSGTAKANLPPVLSDSGSASAEIRFPQFVVAGVSFRPTEKWNLEFDVDWTDWDSVDNISIHNPRLGDTLLLLNYRSSFMYEFGVTRHLGKGYFASLGYFYSENSSPDRDFNPIIPDADLHLGSVGFGYRGKHWDWAIAYHFGYNPGREVTNDITNPEANGTYHILNHAFNIAATFKF